jgi:hypothetical protein
MHSVTDERLELYRAHILCVHYGISINPYRDDTAIQEIFVAWQKFCEFKKTCGNATREAKL